jgi:ribose transport system substrate-binding protein
MIKKFIYLLALILLVGTLIGCADQTGTDSSNKKNNSSSDEVVFSTIMVTNNDWALTLAEGAEEKAKEYGYKHITMNSESDIQKQIDLVQSAISQKVTGLYIQPVDSTAIVPILKKAAEAGIYIFTMNELQEALGDYENVYFANYDHAVAGAKAAEAIAESIGGKGKVGIIAGIAGADNTKRRSDGFRKVIEEKYPDIKIINEISADWDRAIAMNASEDMITGNKDIDAFYSMGEEMAWGVLEAVDNSGKDIKVVTIDAATPTVELVMNGKIYAAIGCPPKSFSGKALEIMKTLLEGGKAEKTYGIEPTFMTKETASLNQADY